MISMDTARKKILFALALAGLAAFAASLLSVAYYFIAISRSERERTALASLASPVFVPTRTPPLNTGDPRFPRLYPGKGSDGSKTYGAILFVKGDLAPASIYAVFLSDGRTAACGFAAPPHAASLKEPEERDALFSIFLNKGASTPLPSSKADLKKEALEAISGATYSFLELSGVLRSASDYVKALKDR